MYSVLFVRPTDKNWGRFLPIWLPLGHKPTRSITWTPCTNVYPQSCCNSTRRIILSFLYLTYLVYFFCTSLTHTSESKQLSCNPFPLLSPPRDSCPNGSLNGLLSVVPTVQQVPKPVPSTNVSNHSSNDTPPDTFGGQDTFFSKHFSYNK